MFWELIEVQYLTSWVAFKEVCGGLLVNSFVIQNKDVEAPVSEHCCECLRDLDALPLDGIVRARDPADFVYFGEF